MKHLKDLIRDTFVTLVEVTVIGVMFLCWCAGITIIAIALYQLIK